MQRQQQGRRVDFVIPTLNAKQENVQRRMDNLMTLQGWFGVIMVGVMKWNSERGEYDSDTTWNHLTDTHLHWGGISPSQEWQWYPNPKSLSPRAVRVRYIQGSRLTVIEVEIAEEDERGGYREPEGRRTNTQRNVGCRFSKADVLILSDGKITHPTAYVPKALHLLEEKQVGAIAGEVMGMFDNPPHWIDVFGAPGGSIFRRFPTFGGSFYLDASNIGTMRTLPVTASWVMTREAVMQMAGFFEPANISYEDFMSCQRFIDNGGRFWLCNEPDFRVLHNTRKSWDDMKKEWKRSGAAAADMLHYFPHSPFANKRFSDVTKVLVAFLLGIAGFLSFFITGHADLLIPLGILGLLLYAGAGVANVITSKRLYGFFFPAVTAYLLVRFSLSYLRQHIWRDGAKRLFQSIWVYLSFALAVVLLSGVVRSIQ